MGKLVWSPSDWIEVEGKGIYAEFEDENAPLSTLAPSQRNGSFSNSRFPVGVVTRSLRPFAYDERVYADPKIELEKTRASLEARFTLPGHLLSLAGSYDNEDGFQHLFDGAQRPCVAPGVNRGATATVCSAQNSEFRNTMFEVRIASTGDRPLQYIAGASWVDLHQRQFFFQPVTGSIFLPFHNGDFESWSVYGSVSYDLTQRLTLGFEARYNEDDGTFISWGSCQPVSSTGAVNRAPCATAGDPFTGTPAASLGKSEAGFSAFLPRVTADYKITDDILLYALYSEGNQPGNINTTPNVPPSLREVKEEELENYEIGLKTTLLEGRLLLNLAAYRMDWVNQIFRRTVTVTLSSGLTTTLPLNVNEGNSRVTGLEMESRWRLNENLELAATLAYVKSRYERFCSEFGFTLTGQQSRPGERCLDVDGNRLEGSPDWTASLSTTYTKPLSRVWDGYARADYFYTGTKYAEPLNLAQTGSANVINLRLGLDNDKWRFEIYGENVTDEDAPTRLASLADATLGTSAPGTGTQNLQPVLRRRAQYGIRALAEF